MAAKPAWESLDSIQAFVSYQDQNAASAAGAPGAKEYVSTRDRKAWFDPKPGDKGATPENPQGFKDHFEMGGVKYVRYLHAFKGQIAPDQSGIVENLVMTLDEAGKVNIMPSGPGMTNVPTTGKDVPTPFRQGLSPTQKLLRKTPMEDFDIRNMDVILPAEQAAQDAQSIFAGVVRIEAKVDKLLAKFQIT